MIITVFFKDSLMPKKLNLQSDKEFLPNERNEKKTEASKLLKDKGITNRKFEIQ